MREKYLLKYTTDRILAFAVICLSSPILILIATLIKVEGLFFSWARGPVLVSNLRVSEGKPFRFYKFRKTKKEVLDSVKQKKPGTFSLTQLQKNPGNLTYVGKVLKKFYLDEFPQVFNILRGDLSFVGPRPRPLAEVKKEFKKGIMHRKVMRCGLTGLVAINKDLHVDKSHLDDKYLEMRRTYSPIRLLIYDMWVMLETLALIFRAKGF